MASFTAFCILWGRSQGASLWKGGKAKGKQGSHAAMVG